MSLEEVFFCPNCMAKIFSEDVICPECGGNVSIQNAPHQLQINNILNGRYLIGRVLGEGGFGITYLGYDLRTNTKAAIKEYFPSGLSYRFSAQSNTVSVHDKASLPQFEKGKQRFLEEAKTVYRFKEEENIVDVLDFFSENNTAYIVMEYIDGMSLSQYLKKNGPVNSFEELYKMLRPVMVSLSRVHDAGLIHRDISPSNLMIDKDGSVKLLDFGTARAMSEDGERSLSVVLKHGFAPMEQYKTHGRQGAWTDVYALCATMYKMLTGQTPTSAMDRMDNEMPLPSALGAKISPAQEKILFKGLSLPVSERIQSVSELIELFDSVTKSEPEEKTKAKKKTPANGADKKPAKKKSNLSLLIALCAVIVVVASCFAVMKVVIPEIKYNKIQVGDYISFGKYEQDNDTTNGKEDIEWLVLDREDNKILVISKYGLDAKQYNVESNSTSTTNTDSGSAQTQQSGEEQSTYEELLDMAYQATGGMRSESNFVTWENCALRSWLNGDFYNAAFSENEKQAIVQTTVSAGKNPEYNTDPGNDTTDIVFLLSINEVNNYFASDSARKCAATDYAIAQGARPNSNYKIDGGFSSWWWLRSPGCYQSQAAFVDRVGSVYYYGDFVNFDKGCVRPALWINLDTIVARANEQDSTENADAAVRDDSAGSDVKELKSAEIGDYVYFGTYEQDNDTSNGKENIKWLVLDRQDNKILVISKYGLDVKPYNESFAGIPWEHCTLRSWLNSDFYNLVFSKTEQISIVPTTVSADENPKYSTYTGNDTTDNIFLLSINEVNKYFSSDIARQCVATDYTIVQEASTSSKHNVDGEETCWWWLRSPGNFLNYTAFVYSDGSLSYRGYRVSCKGGCVRPALWINVGA